MKEIKVRGSDRPMLIDDEDFDVMSGVDWKLHPLGYAWGYVRKEYAEKFHIKHGQNYAHRLVMGNPKGTEVDHQNLDKLDCQKHNLRYCTHRQNTANRPKRKDAKSSKFIGVHYDSMHKRFVASIYKKEGGRLRIGCKSEKDAAALYNEMAKEHYGEYANLNII